MSSFYKMDPAAWDFGTAALSLEQEAAYLRIVNAIHKHDAPVPNVDRVLAGLFRCSTRKARTLVEALVKAGKVTLEDGKIWNDRARSDMVQRQFASGSAAVRGAKGGRTRANNAAKALENNKPAQANASSRIEENRIEQQQREAAPINDPTDRERLLTAMGADPSGITGPSGSQIGTELDMLEAGKWKALGLSLEDQCRLIAERRAKMNQPPRRFSYFTQMLADYAAARSKPIPAGNAGGTFQKTETPETKIARWRRMGEGRAVG